MNEIDTVVINEMIESIQSVANENIRLQSRINELELRIIKLETKGKLSWAGL